VVNDKRNLHSGQERSHDNSILNLTAKTAKRLRGYLIRLTRGYTDGGMDSRAELIKSTSHHKGLYRRNWQDLSSLKKAIFN
jgi:hypothetical protein